MEESYTVFQWMFYHRFNILNAIFALYVLVQLIQLIRDIRKDVKCNECVKSGKCSNYAGERGSDNSLRLLIKDSIVNSRIISRHSTGSNRDGKQGDSER